MNTVITEEAINWAKVVTCICTVGQKTLNWVYMNGCQSSPNETLEKYLERVGWSKKQIKNCFNDTMRTQIDGDPTGATWDISLLFKVIQKTCGNIAKEGSPEWDKSANTVESLVTKIKDYRNDAFHGRPTYSTKEVDNFFTEFIDKCISLVLKTSVKYNVQPLVADKFTSEIKQEINKLKHSAWSLEDVIITLEKHFDEILPVCNVELNSLYAEWSKIVPVFFLDGYEFEVHVDSVFTEMVVTDAGRITEKNKNKIDIVDVLSTTNENIILVEGQAGSGKSTLLKYLLSNWSRKEHTSVKKLDQFDVILFFECRNTLMSSLNDLINFLVSKTVAKYSMIDFLRNLMKRNVLFLLDGLDEMNDNSRTLVREILDMTIKPNIFAMATSRPSELKNFYKMKPASSKVKHLRLDGIPHSLHEVFVERLHKQILPNEEHKTAMLVQYIREAPENVRQHFLYPLNLTLITMLWIISPEVVHRVTTVTTLYSEILDLVNEKLCERLKKNPVTESYEADDLLKASQQAYSTLCNRALVDLLQSKFVFASDSVNAMRLFCSRIKLLDGSTLAVPYIEVIEAYMSVKQTWTSKNSQPHYSYPHRSFQEHMAAVAACEQIKNEGTDIEQLINNWNVPLKSFCYTFSSVDLYTHLIGVIRCEGIDFLHKQGPILIHLLGAKLDALSSEWWLTFVSESLNDDLIAKNCSEYIPKDKWFINNENAASASAVLKYKEPEKFDLNISAEPQHVSVLPCLIKHLANSDSEVSFKLYYNYWLPKYGNNNVIAETVFKGSCRVTEFTGHLKGEMILKLPVSLTALQIAIDDEEDIVAFLGHVCTLANLNSLEVHLSAGIPLMVFTPLPSLLKPSLTFSGITDDLIVWLINSAIKLQPSNVGLHSLYVVGVLSPSSTSGHSTAGGEGLTKQGYIYLLESISQAAFCSFNKTPIRKELIYPKCDQVLKKRDENYAASLKSQKKKEPKEFGVSANRSLGFTGNPQQNLNPFSQKSSINPFATPANDGLPNSSLSLYGNVMIWSPMFNDEEREDIKSNHSKCFYQCKLMKGTPF